MKKFILIISALIFVIAAYAGYGYFASFDEVAVVGKGSVVQKVSEIGRLVSSDEYNLAFPISGQILDIVVDIGDKVEKGQILATIGKGTLLEQLTQASEDIRYQKQTLYEMKRDRNTYSKNQIEGQRAKVAGAEAAWAAIERQINDTILKAPSGGTITRVTMERGERIAAQQILVSIISQVNFELEIYIAEEDISQIQPGQKIKFSLDAFSGKERFTATLISIEPTATMIEAEVYYKVKAKILEDIPGVREGMTADADIIIASRNNVVRVPLEAIEKTGDAEFVWVAVGNFKKEKRQIKTGLSDNGWAEIISGLSDGEKIIVQ